MKTVLCYGDSNTYGYSPLDGDRWGRDIRWTARLQKLLGDEYMVIEEGCNGRTTIYDDPYDEWKNGLTYLKPCLNSHKPIDIITLMLGTNDLKKYFGVGAKDISEGAEKLVLEIKAFSESKGLAEPKIILIAPPLIGEGIVDSCFGVDFDERSVSESKMFAKYYEEVANRTGCIYVDAAKVVEPSKEDSLHLMPSEHEKLASKLCEVIKNVE